jgi:hypothetical protein
MTAIPYDHVLTENLQTSAEFILMKAPEEWAGWVKFLVTELESHLEPELSTQLLQELQALIAERLETGGW